MKRTEAVAFAACTASDLGKGEGGVHTGIGFLDHMLDQFHSHAQIGLGLQWVPQQHQQQQQQQGKGGEGEGCPDHDEANQREKVRASANSNTNANINANADQAELLGRVGASVGEALYASILQCVPMGSASTFSCPLDEALTTCTLVVMMKKKQGDESSGAAATATTADVGGLTSYRLAPYGKFPSTGRTHIGKLKTAAIRSFWEALALHSGLQVVLTKVRGDNAHHIVESSFKAFSRALRNLVDGVDAAVTLENSALLKLYGPSSENYKAGVAMRRMGTVTRKTKETSIRTKIQMDGGAAGISSVTGVTVLDHFFTQLAATAGMSLEIDCNGDLWIDEHHTAEDVAIAVGQVLNSALGTKAGLNRMWCGRAIVNDTIIEVTMDLSNRPCFTHNLSLDAEMVEDLSLEMFEHILDSVVVNARMTVHIVEIKATENLKDTVTATAQAFGHALKYCAMIDGRRAGATASSKGTLSV